MTIFRYRSAHRGKSSDGLPGGSLAGRLIKRCSLYGCGLAILAGFVTLRVHQESIIVEHQPSSQKPRW